MSDAKTGSVSPYLTIGKKNFASALEAFFEHECPSIGGTRIRKTLVDSILQMVAHFYPSTTNLKPGQTIWTTVDAKEKGRYGKTIENTKLIPVILDLIPPEEILRRANGIKLREIKKDAIARICIQSYEQGGCVTQADIAAMLKVSTSTVGKYIKEYEQEHDVQLPRRGTIHDMGPTLTHKRLIIEKLFIECKTVQAVSRETDHSLHAIERYITTFRRVLICYRKGMGPDEIARIMMKSKRLIDEYLSIIDEYKQKEYILDKLESYEVRIETFLERTINEI